MSHQLTFRLLHEYDAGLEGISFDATLSHAEKQTRVKAKLDTGASFCIFQREHGEELDIEIERGTKQRIGTATGSFIAYGHEVKLITLGLEIDTTIYFAEFYGFPRNVLGRRGWLDQVRLALIDYEGKLFLSNYNE